MRCLAKMFIVLFSLVLLPHAFADSKKVLISVDDSTSKAMPRTLFGIFFEEINHAGVGGLWADFVINRGFEAVPGGIKPWTVIGDDNSIKVKTDLSSCFEHNKKALRMDVFCDGDECPNGGVGVYNPGFGGMNIEKGKDYKVTLFARGIGKYKLTVSFVGSDKTSVLTTTTLLSNDGKPSKWKKIEVSLTAKATDRHASLQITTNKQGTIWIDQVSAMPVDTYNGHGFRKDLMQMLVDLKPGFLRFPGGCFVEGQELKNAFKWKETVGPWENRPGHYGDVWHYWTDDGLGYLEFLQLAEDLKTTPVWVINVGISHTQQVNGTALEPYVQDMLDSLEFANGDESTQWGSLRAKYGHPKPFDLKYVAVGNEDCWKQFPMYHANYLTFYNAIKAKYPDIKVISNCDATEKVLDTPADLYDFHIYTDTEVMFGARHKFDTEPRVGPKAFISEYAVANYSNMEKGKDNNGTLMGAVSEAGFLIGVERNSDVVSMASYAPLFMHRDDQTWRPDAINFDSWRAFGIPSYWMQTFFYDSNGATLLNVTQSTDENFISSAIIYKSSKDNKMYTKVKVVNFQNDFVSVTINLKKVGLDSMKGVTVTTLTSDMPRASNSFENPTKVVPKTSTLNMHGTKLNAVLNPYSLTAFDFLNPDDDDDTYSDHSKFDKIRKALKPKP